MTTFREVDSNDHGEKGSLQDTGLFPGELEYEVRALPPQRWCPSPTNGDKEDRYKKFVASSKIALLRRAKILHYSQHRILFDGRIHHGS